MVKLRLPLREQVFTVQIACCMDFLVVVGELGLHCVGGQEHGCLWGTVDVVIEDSLLHLQEEQPLRGILD